MTTYTILNHTIDSAALPEKSIAALLGRGFSHVFGNEVASQVTSKIKAELGDGHEKADIETFRNEHADMVAGWHADFVAAKVETLVNGTIGERTGSGPRGTALDTIKRAVAWEDVKAKLTAKGLSFPKGKDAKLEFGNGEKLTKGELITRYIAKNDEDVTKEATRRMKLNAKAGETADDLI